MPAFVWNTNHRMWRIVPPFADSLAVLEAYITDPAAYVYWSTPRLTDAIAAGDLAYIHCTVDNPGSSRPAAWRSLRGRSTPAMPRRSRIRIA